MILFIYLHFYYFLLLFFRFFTPLRKVGVTVLIGFTVLIPFTMILIGASHMDQCPAENIPTFLLVGGIVWVLKNSLNFWSSCRRNNMNNSGNEAEFQARHKKRESLLNCFLFGWFIACKLLLNFTLILSFFKKKK